MATFNSLFEVLMAVNFSSTMSKIGVLLLLSRSSVFTAFLTAFLATFGTDFNSLLEVLMTVNFSSTMSKIGVLLLISRSSVFTAPVANLSISEISCFKIYCSSLSTRSCFLPDLVKPRTAHSALRSITVNEVRGRPCKVTVLQGATFSSDFNSLLEVLMAVDFSSTMSKLGVLLLLMRSSVFTTFLTVAFPAFFGVFVFPETDVEAESDRT